MFWAGRVNAVLAIVAFVGLVVCWAVQGPAGAAGWLIIMLVIRIGIRILDTVWTAATGIHQHLQAIGEIDERRQSGGFERRRAMGALACHIADELIAGRPAPCVEHAERFTRIDGLLPALANELVSQHDMAIAHRTHLAERLEADGGENGAKAAAILRGMNALAEAQVERDISGNLVSVVIDGLEATVSEFAGLQRVVQRVAREAGHDVARSFGEQIAAASTKDTRMARYRAQEAARRERSLAKAAEEKIRAAEKRGYCEGSDAAFAIFETKIPEAELRGFYQGRNKAWTIVMNRLAMMPGLHEDGQAVLRAVSKSIAMMQKEG